MGLRSEDEGRRLVRAEPAISRRHLAHVEAGDAPLAPSRQARDVRAAGQRRGRGRSNDLRPAPAPRARPRPCASTRRCASRRAPPGAARPGPCCGRRARRRRRWRASRDGRGRRGRAARQGEGVTTRAPRSLRPLPDELARARVALPVLEQQLAQAHAVRAPRSRRTRGRARRAGTSRRAARAEHATRRHGRPPRPGWRCRAARSSRVTVSPNGSGAARSTNTPEQAHVHGEDGLLAAVAHQAWRAGSAKRAACGARESGGSAACAPGAAVFCMGGRDKR